jgi:8-oxo-dGTP pyrophosphatase MutT (NUDIX family)
LGVQAERANQTLQVETAALDYYVAAIRELFEESGVLLADCTLDAAALDRVRAALNNQTLQWSDIVCEHKLGLRCDALHYFAHWITPLSMEKRYSTRFFVAELPQGQAARHDERELTDSVWITAADALASHRAGSIELHFPTAKTLEAVSAHASVDSLIDWASRCAAAGVKAVRPLIGRGGKPEIHEPESAADTTS